MSERRIVCPQCKGSGNALCFTCATCDGGGTISDRRKPTANDRAVERIKALCEFGGIDMVWTVADGRTIADGLLIIIREEAEKDG